MFISSELYINCIIFISSVKEQSLQSSMYKFISAIIIIKNIRAKTNPSGTKIRIATFSDLDPLITTYCDY